MILRVSIVTDDSGVKLPEMDRYREKIGKGVEPSKHAELMKTLKADNIVMPTNDLENEEHYRSKLSDFVRPARYMFSGMFSEVRVFHEELSGLCNAELYIISGRYGLISHDEQILPYEYHLKDLDTVKDLDARTGFLDRLISETSGSEYLMVFLNRLLLSYLLDNRLRERISESTKLIVVGSSAIKDNLLQNGHVFLQRRGVARIGKDNREKIKKIISGDN